MIDNNVSLKEWIVVCLLLMIPIVNIILLFYWAFGKKSFKTNFARAYLIVFSIFIGIGFVLAFTSFLVFSTYETANETSNQMDLYENYEKVFVSDYAEDDLEILEINHRLSDTEVIGLIVEMIIQNNSEDLTHENTLFELGFYDKSDILIGTYNFSTDNIPPGDKYKKELFLFERDVENVLETASIKLISIN